MKPGKHEEAAPGDIFRVIEADEGGLSARAVQQIRELIRTGELARGDRLPAERDLSERLGVSRTVVREAIKMLRASGLVKVRLGVGTFISEDPVNILEGNLSYAYGQEVKKITDLQQAREVLEPAIAALAAQNATPERIRKIEDAVLEMEASLANSHRYIEADRLFHMALAEAADNSVFVVLLNSIVDLLQEARHLAISTPGAGERSSRYHRRILEAIRARDPAEASSVMTEHMQQAQRDIHASLRSQSVR